MRPFLSSFFAIAFASLLLISCSVQTKEVYDPKTDFSKYKTFCWMNGCEQSSVNLQVIGDTLAYERIKAAIMEELERKGLKQDSNNPDLLVGFTVTIKDEETIVYHRPEDTPIYFRPIEADEEVIHYLKGSLIVGIADARESQMVWQSHAVSYMETKPELTDADLHKGIRKILKNFPPKPITH